MKRVLGLIGALTVACCASVVTPSAGAATPSVGHVFVIVLENEDAGTTFAPGSPVPYLATTLRR